MLLILPPGEKLIEEYQMSKRIDYAPLFSLWAISLCFLFYLRPSLCFFIRPAGGKFMLLILPPGGKPITEDELSEHIAYAPLFGLRALILCFSVRLRAGSLL